MQRGVRAECLKRLARGSNVRIQTCRWDARLIAPGQQDEVGEQWRERERASETAAGWCMYARWYVRVTSDDALRARGVYGDTRVYTHTHTHTTPHKHTSLPGGPCVARRGARRRTFLPRGFLYPSALGKNARHSPLLLLGGRQSRDVSRVYTHVCMYIYVRGESRDHAHTHTHGRPTAAERSAPADHLGRRERASWESELRGFRERRLAVTSHNNLWIAHGIEARRERRRST